METEEPSDVEAELRFPWPLGPEKTTAAFFSSPPSYVRLDLLHVFSQGSQVLSSHKTFRIKQFLAKKQKQNHPIPQWIRMKTGNKMRYNSKRRHWRRTTLGL
ncbi:60S ribosomal protein L39-like [Orcinus orca]|uniref:60S ribosomal protein L39-like n=1 Tax=Orcinus orca TaxID=9733 RepID=UPI0014421EEC|nr:60S ribosomal protein L39-like [Orcinus orca]XP_060149675.1 large ribosomal subunit protein eL39-like [Globicephala melas]